MPSGPNYLLFPVADRPCAGEYYRSPQPPGGVNSNNDGSDPTPMHEATKENLLALIAESDDD